MKRGRDSVRSLSLQEVTEAIARKEAEIQATVQKLDELKRRRVATAEPASTLVHVTDPPSSKVLGSVISGRCDTTPRAHGTSALGDNTTAASRRPVAVRSRLGEPSAFPPLSLPDLTGGDLPGRRPRAPTNCEPRSDGAVLCALPLPAGAAASPGEFLCVIGDCSESFSSARGLEAHQDDPAHFAVLYRCPFQTHLDRTPCSRAQGGDGPPLIGRVELIEHLHSRHANEVRATAGADFSWRGLLAFRSSGEMPGAPHAASAAKGKRQPTALQGSRPSQSSWNFAPLAATSGTLPRTTARRPPSPPCVQACCRSMVRSAPDGARMPPALGAPWPQVLFPHLPKISPPGVTTVAASGLTTLLSPGARLIPPASHRPAAPLCAQACCRPTTGGCSAVPVGAPINPVQGVPSQHVPSPHFSFFVPLVLPSGSSTANSTSVSLPSGAITFPARPAMQPVRGLSELQVSHTLVSAHAAVPFVAEATDLLPPVEKASSILIPSPAASPSPEAPGGRLLRQSRSGRLLRQLRPVPEGGWFAIAGTCRGKAETENRAGGMRQRSSRASQVPASGAVALLKQLRGIADDDPSKVLPVAQAQEAAQVATAAGSAGVSAAEAASVTGPP